MRTLLVALFLVVLSCASLAPTSKAVAIDCAVPAVSQAVDQIKGRVVTALREGTDVDWAKQLADLRAEFKDAVVCAVATYAAQDTVAPATTSSLAIVVPEHVKRARAWMDQSGAAVVHVAAPTR